MTVDVISTSHCHVTVTFLVFTSISTSLKTIQMLLRVFACCSEKLRCKIKGLRHWAFLIKFILMNHKLETNMHVAIIRNNPLRFCKEPAPKWQVDDIYSERPHDIYTADLTTFCMGLHWQRNIRFLTFEKNLWHAPCVQIIIEIMISTNEIEYCCK